MQQKDSSENSKDSKSKSSRSESIASSSSLSETNFFYTSDKFFNTFEDDEITYYI